MLNFPKISNDKAGWLVRPFDDVEVFGVVKDFEGDKAPGLDGFPMAFFQACWDVIKLDLMEIFQVFFERPVREKFKCNLYLLDSQKVRCSRGERFSAY